MTPEERVEKLVKDLIFYNYNVAQRLAAEKRLVLGIREAEHAAADEVHREYKTLFDLSQDADMRAIKLWQKETGRDLEWPDSCKLIVWLLEKLDGASIRLRDLERQGGLQRKRGLQMKISQELNKKIIDAAYKKRAAKNIINHAVQILATNEAEYDALWGAVEKEVTLVSGKTYRLCHETGEVVEATEGEADE